MGLRNILILSQIAGHIVAFILSLCILIPMANNVHQFDGHCLLFATGQWQEDDGRLKVIWPAKGYCNFPIATASILFFISIIQIYRLSRLAYKELEASFLGLLLDVIFSIAMGAMVILSAIMITLGFISWCSVMTQRFPSCEIAAGQNITTDPNIDTSYFYVEVGTAQFGAWSSFAIWVGLSLFALIKLISNHQMINMKYSMYLERQRLMQHSSSRDGGSTPPALAEI